MEGSPNLKPSISTISTVSTKFIISIGGWGREGSLAGPNHLHHFYGGVGEKDPQQELSISTIFTIFIAYSAGSGREGFLAGAHHFHNFHHGAA